MGRELKRVAIDFNWPLNKTWGGYINPFYSQRLDCPECGGRGYSPEARLLHDKWYGYVAFKPEDRGSVPYSPHDEVIWLKAKRNVTQSPGCYGKGTVAIESEAERLCKHFNSHWCYHLNADDVSALLQAARLHDLTHVWTREHGWKPKDPAFIPTPTEVNEWALQGMGHDSINQWIVCKAECERNGWPYTCALCNGDGDMWPSLGIKKQAEQWERTEPPTGDGYQLWETVSEGSPISPVFESAEELADWLAESRDYAWRKNDAGTTREQWLKFINGPGWAPSFIGVGGELVDGVKATTT